MRQPTGWEVVTRALVSSSMAWNLALCAVATEFIVSGNLLTNLGSAYTSEGGLFLQKVHPGSYLAITSGTLTAMRGAYVKRTCSMDGQLAAFLAGVTLCIFYAIATTGMGNVVVLIDTFLSSGMLALALREGDDDARKQLRRIIRFLLILNGCIAVCEVATQAHLVSIPTGAAGPEREFRPTALYDHALTGAAVTMLGLWLAPTASGIGRWCYVSLLVAALLAFGERTPLAAALLGLLACVARRHGARMLARNLGVADLAPLAAIGIVAFAALAIAAFLNMETRLGGHLYWDNSAQVRISQFAILDELDDRQLFFGCPRADLLALIEPLRLSSHVAVIENFWLFTFVALGLFCFPVFVLSFVSLLKWLWRMSSTNGHFMIVAFVAVASASNSLGRKSTLLVTLVACVIASTPSLAGARLTEVSARE